MVIISYGIRLTPFTSFKYLGRFISSADNNWPAVVHNLHRARQKQVRLSRVMSREGADSRTVGIIYVTVFNVVMMYFLETWGMKICIGRVWGGFHHRVDLSLTGIQPRRGQYGGWLYLPMVDTIAEAGL